MTDVSTILKSWSSWANLGLLWLSVAFIGAAIFFSDGLEALLAAWSLPEYSHGPLIPILSGFLFLRQLRNYPIELGPKEDRWVGVTVVVFALILATIGKMSAISDLVAYATILWIWGILLISFGWSTGKDFWPPVLHLVYMLPLPDTIYYQMSIWLQFISSELGVWFLQLMAVPVFLDGNIIDLGITKLHVAEACSGLRYLFPILSFSYIFAVLYKGPVWHKAVLLISAAPITVFMNSLRIAVAGLIVQYWGLGWLEGFTHFFEGWVIFVLCILILFGLARLMLLLNDRKTSLAEALDLSTDGLIEQAARVRFIMASPAMITAALLLVVASLSWQVLPERTGANINRDSFSRFPHQLGEWRQDGPPQRLAADVERVLGADDYLSVMFTKAGGQTGVEFFSAWYDDQSQGGVHSPEICLPGGGWEIAWLERTDISARLNTEVPYTINRAIIQKGETRMMVFYWFDQKGRKIAWDIAAKYFLLVDGLRTGRTDGALVRLTTAIRPDETNATAEARLMDFLGEIVPILPRFIPESH